MTGGAPSASPDVGPLLERTAELRALAAALEAACSGTGAVVLVEGAAGIGKTSLLNAARHRAQARGMAVLSASGSQLERSFAMGVVRQCFEPELRRHERPETLLAGAAGLAARALVEVPAAEDAAPGGVLHGLYWLTANIAERTPLLIAIDDAHWADEASLLFACREHRRTTCARRHSREGRRRSARRRRWCAGPFECSSRQSLSPPARCSTGATLYPPLDHLTGGVRP
jgi:hypothetical protein